MRTHHHFGIRLNPFMFLRTELRSKWSDCEPCEKTHHVKSDLSSHEEASEVCKDAFRREAGDGEELG